MKFSKLLLLKTILFLYACTNKNEMELDFSNPLKKEDFKIEIQILGSDVNRKVIYDGNIIYDIPNEYGENEWHFNYKDSLYGYFRHFKSNRNDKHNYTFHFFQKENVLQLPVEKAAWQKKKKKMRGQHPPRSL
jgi:hypothetical protein